MKSCPIYTPLALVVPSSSTHKRSSECVDPHLSVPAPRVSHSECIILHCLLWTHGGWRLSLSSVTSLHCIIMCTSLQHLPQSRSVTSIARQQETQSASPCCALLTIFTWIHMHQHTATPVKGLHVRSTMRRENTIRMTMEGRVG
jgi:hypothetical protein